MKNSHTSTSKTGSRRDMLKASGEFEMAKNRLIIGTLVAIFLHQTVDPGDPWNLQSLNIILAYCVIGPVIFGWIILSPAISTVRRICSMILDLGTLSLLMIFGGKYAAVLYPVYLWVIFGNGFRFGIPFLMAAMGVGAFGFLMVLIYGAYWTNNPYMASGLMLGVVVLPTYAAKLIRDLNRAKAAAETASRAKSRFLASISHEFRTPLHAIVGMSDLLMNSPMRNTQQDMVATVRKSAQSLNALIDTILDFSRLEAGRMPIKSENFDLDRVIIGIMQMLKPQAEKKNISLGVCLDANVPSLVHASRSSLEAIIINLAGNAVKFTSEGSVSITSRLMKMVKGSAIVRFEITDTGIGIDKDAQEHIFEAFSQADDSILDKFGGTGLGLATAKQLVDSQGGQIGVESEPGVGTKFWFELPMAAVEDEASSELNSSEMPAAILFTRDALFVNNVSDPLAQQGVVIHIAENLVTVDQVLTSNENEFGHKPVIFVDEKMLMSEGLPTKTLLELEAPRILVSAEPDESLYQLAEPIDFAAIVRDQSNGPAVVHALRVGALCQSIRTDSDVLVSAIPKARIPANILVADDNRTNRLVMTKILQAAGHATFTATDGEAALDAVADGDIHLVLMDINMPVMNGIEATKHIRVLDIQAGRTTPVVALTADTSDEIQEKCLEAGMNACVGKPVDPPYLLRTIDDLVAAEVPNAKASSDGTPMPIAANDDIAVSRRADVAIDESSIADLIALGGVGFARDVASEFIGEAQATIERLATALDRSDWEELRLQAHALKSTSLNIGATQLAGLCGKDRLPDDGHTLEDRADYIGELRAALRAAINSACFEQLLHEETTEALAG